MTAVPATRPAAPFARTMAFAAYGLMLAGWITFGTSTLVGLVLAYARRDGAPPMERSHHRFQIRLFWIGLAMAAAAAALAVSAFLDASRSPAPFLQDHVRPSPHAQLIAYRPAEPPATVKRAQFHSFTYRYNSHALTWRTRALLEGYTAAILAAFAAVWSVAAPVWGLARLASGRPMGHRA